MDFYPIRVVDIFKKLNQDIFLPAIQREFVWDINQIERLFDSLMDDFPIGSFLFWKLREEKKEEWPVYKFIQDYDEEHPHNPRANMAGITRDITLVLDGQQRISSLFIGLGGSYRRFYYRWRKERLYLNLLKRPQVDDDNPEELTYGFAFRESDESEDELQLWYRVGRILDFADAEDAKSDIRSRLNQLPDEQRDMANKLIGRLHNRVHTRQVGSYYEERSQDYERALQIFVRTNSGGTKLGYSDLLLATAIASWHGLDAREEIHNFTDRLNEIGGYSFDKDFVLKACLFLSKISEREYLPIQYKVKNFTQANLNIIRNNWDDIKSALCTTVKLIDRFGFKQRDLVARLAILPIAFFIRSRGNPSFWESSHRDDVGQQIAIRRWLIFSILKRVFGQSSDTILNRLREILIPPDPSQCFPSSEFYKLLGIEPQLGNDEIDRILEFKYQGQYTNLVLSLLYPDKRWRNATFHQDHIFPKSLFTRSALRSRNYDDATVKDYLAKYDTIANLQLLTNSENLSKSNTEFDEWIQSRDEEFRNCHLIPPLSDYSLDNFGQFVRERSRLIRERLQGTVE